MNASEIHLTLFLSRATPLGQWSEMGILDRELAVYRRLAARLGSVSIVTSGGVEELDYRGRLGSIRILYNRWGLSPNLYSLLAPFLHARALREATVLKTNQLDGAWSAVIAGNVHRRPVVVRAGYGWALSFRRDHGETSKARVIRGLERWTLRRADRVVVTTPALREYVYREHGVPLERARVIPNYVDTDRFRPLPDARPEEGRVVFVGRLSSAKNLPALLQAVAQVPAAQLTLIGDGPLRPHLEALVGKLGIVERVTFAGRMDHSQLPEVLGRAQAFALVSHYEGHPKALIEAMACGLAPLGADVDGIREVIRHEETGLLCPPTPDGIAAELRRLLQSVELREKLGRAAREYAVREFSLDRVVELELAMLAGVSGT